MKTAEKENPEMAPAAQPPDPDPYGETSAMSAAYNALCGLDHDAQLRALDWLTARLSNDNFHRERARRAAGGSGYDDEPPF